MNGPNVVREVSTLLLLLLLLLPILCRAASSAALSHTGGSTSVRDIFSKVRREFDAGRVNLDPPMTCVDWPVPGNLTVLHTQTGYTRKP